MIHSKALLSLLLLIFCTTMSCRTKEPINSKMEEPVDDDVTPNEFNYAALGMGNILIDSQTTYRYKSNFSSKIRRFPLGVINDKISKSVWFDREAIKFLAKYLEESKDLDGVRIHMISYDSLNTAPGQYMPHQISMVLVPTNPNPKDPTEHIDNWNILKMQKHISDSILLINPNFKNGLNHGELCPRLCPDGDD